MNELEPQAQEQNMQAQQQPPPEQEVWVKQEAPGGSWKPDKEGEELIGKVININNVGDLGKQYTVLAGDGMEVLTPTDKVLQNRMSKIQVGDAVKLVYGGEESPAVKGQNPTKLYDVFKKGN